MAPYSPDNNPEFGFSTKTRLNSGPKENLTQDQQHVRSCKQGFS
jgi:hypothetical protein